MNSLAICDPNIKWGTKVIGPDHKDYVVTDARKVGAVREYELTLLNGQWSNWFALSEIKGIY